MSNLHESKKVLPVIYTAHHASHDFREFSDRCALSDEERVRFSDYGTDSQAAEVNIYGTDETVARNGLATLIAAHSRALGDLNRAPDDPGRFQEEDYARPNRHPIWKEGISLSNDEKVHCDTMYFQPFHQAIVDAIIAADQPVLVVAWDNTAHYNIGVNDAGEEMVMKPFILSNRGAEESVESSLVYKGGYITRHYSSHRNDEVLRSLGITHPIQSLQVEYDTSITHDKQLKPNHDAIARLRAAFSEAIESTLASYPLS